MLDADGYPAAFIKYGNLKLEFRNAVRRVDKIQATVSAIVVDSKDN